MNDFDLLDKHAVDGILSQIVIADVNVMTVKAVDGDISNRQRHVSMLQSCLDVYPTTTFSYPELYRKTIAPRLPADFLKPVLCLTECNCSVSSN
jgi:hypothetical protein